MIYQSFQHASGDYKDIKAIDYFFAKEFVGVFESSIPPSPGQSPSQSIEQSNIELLFHLLISLSESVRNGHTCLPLSELANRRVGFESDEQGVVIFNGYQFPSLAQLNSVLLSVVSTEHNLSHGIVFAHQCLYMRKNYVFEQELQQALLERATSQMPLNQHEIAPCIDRLFPLLKENDDEIDWQKLAVANSVNKKFSIIAGGPGTGKTYTVTKLLAAIVELSPQPLSITLVAPTGKAAQRLTESITQAVAGFHGQIDESLILPS